MWHALKCDRIDCSRTSASTGDTRPRQYIDVHRVNDPPEDVGWDSGEQRVMKYVTGRSIPRVFVSNGCGGIDPLSAMMYARIVTRVVISVSIKYRRCSIAIHNELSLEVRRSTCGS
ncbi:hypothetical protein F2P81_010868 [Scophthalmus maximus]|uniref:Uncharacterized protein n=1 Tax=Scophthalmus maximus TaxID=52904 RepID=A0A6A4T440_SCOMX|nr:hypothetical protein F2P81_010868 [Scophthalmus maximus]